MEYLADTVTIIRHFTGKGKIGRSARKILDRVKKGEDVLNISIISFMEIMYLFEKNRIQISMQSLRNEIDKLDNYRIIDLDINILETASGISGLELHDRLIVSTAMHLAVPILTSDETITKSNLLKVIW